MRNEISVRTVAPRLLAAVRREVRIGQVAAAWKPALDQVWAFLRQNPGLRTDGHNVFLCHHPANRQDPMLVDFGVEVTRRFERSAEVFPTETPSGKVASALHVGPYDKLGGTHDAIHAWAVANKLTFAGFSWGGIWGSDARGNETGDVDRVPIVLTGMRE